MALVSLTTITNGTLADATTVMGNYNAIVAQVNGLLDGTNLAPAFQAFLGTNDGTNVRTGSSIIATSEVRTNVAYGVLTTPDQISNIVLPNGGIIEVFYQATWQESVLSAGAAAIFLGSNQAQVATALAPVAANAVIGGAAPARDVPLSTNATGLSGQQAGASGYTGDVATGQFLAAGNSGGIPVGGPAYVFAGAGTYTVSIQFKSTSGSVTVKNRRLYVKAIGF